MNPTLSSSFQWTLVLGHEEAARQGRPATSTSDLLIALTRVDGPASRVLGDFGATEDRLREHLGYEAATPESVVRASIVNRLLPLLGQSEVRLGALIRQVTLAESTDRTAVSIQSEHPNALARFTDDGR